MLKQLLLITLIFYVYFYPILWVLICLRTILAGANIFSKDTNIFVKHGRQRRRRHWHQVPTLYVQIFAKNESPDESTFTWDTYGFPFVVDNYTTAIIWNTRKVFTNHLTPTKIIPETVDRMSANTKLIGTIRLVLTDNAKYHHTYEIPSCIFDPDSPINFFRIPPLGKYFNDSADVKKPFDDDGTNIKSGGTMSGIMEGTNGILCTVPATCLNCICL